MYSHHHHDLSRGNNHSLGRPASMPSLYPISHHHKHHHRASLDYNAYMTTEGNQNNTSWNHHQSQTTTTSPLSIQTNSEFSGYPSPGTNYLYHLNSTLPQTRHHSLSARPKLTTTLWEDEATVCYQVDANGICVARRQDNDMINGTKLLNVVGMSRGKRDGILKNEKGRVVVKVGAMHLKGVWITFTRAKLLAAQHKIQDILYPLFVDNPAIFLPTTTLYSPNRLTRQYSSAWDHQDTTELGDPSGYSNTVLTHQDDMFLLSSQVNYDHSKSHKVQRDKKSRLYDDSIDTKESMDPIFFDHRPILPTLVSPTSSEPSRSVFQRPDDDDSHDKRQSLMMPTPSRVVRHHPYLSPEKGYTFKYDMTGYK
ncbi:Cell pattern formation-associated protein stuA [Choanephora cucurbitarum]|uniref:Cell pattern formation-associated protein stuA n=1 Tax=Choanephora cucurbitarum TaxID=101091 RepID=A0A1C7NDW4_9FUNG|nr:Cell pattern formation-associated protein stuA [Choanephora cucurbitarum]